jgi:hypothetical protein
MRRVAVLVALLVTVLGSAAVSPGLAAAGGRSAPRAPQLLAFRGFHLGGGGFGQRHVGYGGLGQRRSSHTLRRVAHAVAFAYFLHLFFSHGGLSILLWVLLIGLVVHFLRRRSRRRYA